MNVGDGMLQSLPNEGSHRHPSKPEDLIELLRIEEGFLGVRGLYRTTSRCTSQSTALVEMSTADLPPSVQHIIQRDRLIARSALVATELLGSDGEDEQTSSAYTYKSNIHLLMTVEMTLQMLFDDLLDMAGHVPDGTKDILLNQILRGFECAASGHDFDRSHEVEGFWKDVLAGLSAMQRWRNELLLRAGIDVQVGSISQLLYVSFIETYYHVHDDFENLAAYFEHRVDNCGMPLQGFWAAHWHARVEGLNRTLLEENGDYAQEMLYRYAILGGLSNDIVGYDKDVQEGVATAVEVLARDLPGPRGARVQRAFREVIDHHNELLEEFGKQLATSRRGTLQYAVLQSLLRTAWSIHVLHESYIDVYSPNTLLSYLGQREATRVRGSAG